MPRTLFSFRGLILVFGLVAVCLPIALVAQLGIVRTLNAVNGDLADIREGQLAAAAILQYQLDEETSVRGYAATGRAIFLEPYERARIVVPGEFAHLDALATGGDDLGITRRDVAELRHANDEWVRTVAEPILKGKPSPAQEQLLLHGKTEIDRFRDDLDAIDVRFSARYAAAIAHRDLIIRTTTWVALLATAVIAIELIAFAAVVARMRRELDRERAVADTLQSATAVRFVAPAHLAIGNAYRSATRGTRVGGDVYDVYRLDADRTLIVVGDVSGKGLSAAVDTTFVRYAVRTLASEGLAPAEIVHRFDGLYHDANPAAEGFVTLFVGIHDRRDATLAYANAGHEACWVRRGRHVAMLAPTGPIVGLGGLPFGGAITPLGPADVLVLATDGLTEARDPSGAVVPVERVTDWIAHAPAATPQALVDELVAEATRYARGRITDDLAVLVIRPLA